MSVCVKNMRGGTLMLTTPQKAKSLLKQGKAVIAGYHPFTIQLNYATGEARQALLLGVDAGFKTMGVSITGPTKEFYSCEISLLEGQVERNLDRSDRPGNLITLCNKCHTPAEHKKNGFLYGWEPKTKSFKPETFMSTVRWKLVNTLKCDHTYGYKTKQKRIASGLPKTHYNDAFCIAGGRNQERCEPIFFQQKRKNNRCLEKFYDAKVIDIRTGQKVAGVQLHCGRRTRNKNLNGENLRQYRGAKVSKGRRQIRKQQYSIRPNDIVKFNHRIYRALGVQNRGHYLKMTNGGKPVVKSIKQVEVLFHQKTLMVV